MNINEIIYHQIIGIASEEEKKHLESWLNLSPKHREQFEKLMENCDYLNDYQRHSRIDVDKAWEKLMIMVKEEEGENKKQAKSYSIKWLIRVAALFLFVAGAGWLLLHRESKPELPLIPEAVSQAITQSTESGKSAAKVSIRKKGKEQIQQEITSDAMLAVLTGNEEAVYEIETHRGKEFWVTLPDGSRVHLNYNARLIYPNHFVGDSRQVFVEGEAYFYIAKDKSHPFVVNTNNGMLKQYGTEFYVNAPKESTSVVLVSGSIGVTPKEGSERMIRPGQQAIFNVHKSSLKIEDVDTSLYTAWNEGRMVFEDCPLESLIEVIAKWYDVDYTFTDNNLRAVHLSGTFDRYGTLADILNAISELTNAEASLQDNKVVLGRKVKK